MRLGSAERVRQTAQNIIEVGKRLIQAKSLVQHGHWQNWLEQNFQLTDRTAQRFMQISEKFKTVDVDGFKPSQLTELLALPDAEETEKFIAEKAAEGKSRGRGRQKSFFKFSKTTAPNFFLAKTPKMAIKKKG